MIFIVPLSQIILAPQEEIDLTAIPPAEAESLIRKHYSFLSKNVEVKIDGESATISVPDTADEISLEVRTEYRKAVESAEHGNYSKAISRFTQVLAKAPAFIDARRNLAMALLESGKHDAALDNLIDVLRQNPNDVWAQVLVGNIFLKHKNDLATAERYYQNALDQSPDDPIALTNYGVVLSKTGRRLDAADKFQDAIERNPDYPNAYHALALLQSEEGNLHAAIAVLDSLFARPRSSDRRAEETYEEARRLYRIANEALATTSLDRMMAIVETRKAELEVAFGIPIEIGEDAALRRSVAVCEMAWTHRRNRHRIRYRAGTDRTVLPHILAHELEHIRLDEESHRAGTGRSFSTNPTTQQKAVRVLTDFTEKFKKKGQLEGQLQNILKRV